MLTPSLHRCIFERDINVSGNRNRRTNNARPDYVPVGVMWPAKRCPQKHRCLAPDSDVQRHREPYPATSPERLARKRLSTLSAADQAVFLVVWFWMRRAAQPISIGVSCPQAIGAVRRQDGQCRRLRPRWPAGRRLSMSRRRRPRSVVSVSWWPPSPSHSAGRMRSATR
jgi:hypothetical protein